MIFASLISTWCLSQAKTTPSSVTTSHVARVPGPQKVQLSSRFLLHSSFVVIFKRAVIHLRQCTIFLFFLIHPNIFDIPVGLKNFCIRQFPPKFLVLFVQGLVLLPI